MTSQNQTFNLHKNLESCLNDERNDMLTWNDKQALKETFAQGYYRINYNANDNRDYILTPQGKINKNKIQNFWHLPNFKELPETAFQPEKLRARLDNGEPLEAVVHRALRQAQISFEGNPLNEHYGHSQKQIVDIETEKMLIECTNPMKSTHLNAEAMHEKINYYYRRDPEHKKLWILIISYIECIDQSIRNQLRNIGVQTIVLNTRCHKYNIKLHLNDQIELILTEFNNNPLNYNSITQLLTKLNNQHQDKKYKAVYQIFTPIPINPIDGCVSNISPNNFDNISAG